jgi:2-keto-3-deoxy-L-rhamnonate aldolase RhmA
VLNILIVESTPGVERIAEIVSVEGVDAVIFGWGDFSVESGFDWSRSRDAALFVYEACRKAGVGLALTPGSELGDAFFPGCFYVVGIDSLLISAALTEAVASAARATEPQ